MRRLISTVTLITAALAACDDASGPSKDPSLLLPWAQVSGRIVYATPTQLKLIDSRRREVRVLQDALGSELFVDLASSPVNDEVAAGILRADGTNRISVVSFSGTQTRSIDRATCGRWLPDGRLSYMRGDTLLIEGAMMTVFSPGTWSCPSWSPDGAFLITALKDTTRLSRIYRIGTANPEPQALTLTVIGGPRTSFNDPAVAPGSQVFAVIYGSDDPLTEILLANTSGGIIRKVAEGTRLYGLSWSPESAQLLAVSTVSTAGGLFLIRVSDGAVRKLVEHPVYAASWGP